MKILILNIILFFIPEILISAPQIRVIGDKKIDLGKYPAKEKKEIIYIIKNSGDELLKIKNIRKTCGCAEATTEKTELKPNETTKLKAVILANSIYGSYSKNIYIESNDPKNKILELNVQGDAYPLFIVKPKDKIYAGRLKLGNTWEQSFLIETNEKIIFNSPEVKS